MFSYLFTAIKVNKQFFLTASSLNLVVSLRQMSFASVTTTPIRLSVGPFLDLIPSVHQLAAFLQLFASVFCSYLVTLAALIQFLQ